MTKVFTLVAIVAMVSCTNKKTAIPEQPKLQQTTYAEVPQTEKLSLAETITKVTDAYRFQNQKVLNSFINKKEGFITLYRTGVFNEYKRTALFDFENPVPPNYKYPSVPAGVKLQFTVLPKFDCGSGSWDKHGLYCDTIHKDTLLSGTLENLRAYRGDKIDQKEITRMKRLEEKSVRVLFAQKDIPPFIFYLTLIDNRWYFTAHDRTTGDCSA